MYNLGIDLGGTNICIGLINYDGKVIYKNTNPTNPNRNYKLILKDIVTHCIEILNRYSVSISQIKSIGIGCPGKCWPEKKIVVHSCNINSLNNINIANEIQKHLNLPVYLENDANCAAIAENIFGAAKGYNNSATITLGTGIGGGLIINNKILADTEIGHHVIFSGGEKCSCGRNGCWEAYASATALINQAKLAAINNPNSKLNTKKNFDAKFVFDIAKLNDETAQKIVEQYIFYLAEGLVNIINIFQPEIIVIGGGIIGQGEKILQPLRKIIKNYIYDGLTQTKIFPAKLGNDAGIIGAAFLSKYY